MTKISAEGMEHMIDHVSTFTKYDKGKLMWSKFCWRAAEGVLRVMMHGAEKYGWDNWRQAEAGQLYRYWDAAMRHMIADIQGKVVDEDSGMLAVQHACCSLMFYLEHKLEEREKDKEQGTAIYPSNDIWPTLDDAKRRARVYKTCSVCLTTYCGEHKRCF